MQRILQREVSSDSPRKTSAIPKLEDATVPDKLVQKDDGALAESVLKIRKSSTRTPASVSLFSGIKDESVQLGDLDSIKRGKVLPIVDKQNNFQSSEDERKSDFNIRLLKLEEIKCKNCKSVMS